MAGEAPKPLHFDVAGLVVIPLSPEGYTDTAGIGIGAAGGGTYALSPKLALAGHVGFIYHLPKNDFTQIHIPILAGIRFWVIPKLALGADTGLNIIRVSFEIAGESDSDTNTRIPLALHAAYAITSQLVAGGGLWIPNLLLTEEGEDTALGLALYVGYMF